MIDLICGKILMICITIIVSVFTLGVLGVCGYWLYDTITDTVRRKKTK